MARAQAGAALVREGDAYRLALPEPADVDVITFEQSLASARRAERGSEEMTAALSTALDAYRGDVLPEAGPAEWVIKLRDSYRTEAVGAALRLAEGFLAREQWRAAIRACERGLRIDAYQDGLWHVMVDAQTASGDRAAASRSRVAYDAVLGELGLAPATSPPPPNPSRSRRAAGRSGQDMNRGLGRGRPGARRTRWGLLFAGVLLLVSTVLVPIHGAGPAGAAPACTPDPTVDAPVLTPLDTNLPAGSVTYGERRQGPDHGERGLRHHRQPAGHPDPELRPGMAGRQRRPGGSVKLKYRVWLARSPDRRVRPRALRSPPPP